MGQILKSTEINFSSARLKDLLQMSISITFLYQLFCQQNTNTNCKFKKPVRKFFVEMLLKWSQKSSPMKSVADPIKHFFFVFRFSLFSLSVLLHILKNN